MPHSFSLLCHPYSVLSSLPSNAAVEAERGGECERIRGNDVQSNAPHLKVEFTKRAGHLACPHNADTVQSCHGWKN